MGMRSDYEAYLARRALIEQDVRNGWIWQDQAGRYVKPFRLYGNVWYVGDSWVCVHLIDTGDGLLLIDSGNCGATAMLVQAIWEAGFRPNDVKWIIHSHGHLDHIGGSVFFQKMFGTKLYLSAVDARIFRERPELSLIQDAHNDCDTIFVPDYEIEDGEEITFGNTTIRFVLCPGHTEGVLGLFFDAHNGDEVKRCGYYGGFGFNTLTKGYLQEIGDTELRMRQVYLDSLARVRDEKVDIMLGNHCINNDTLGRREKQMADPDGPNPFIDPTWWRTYLDKMRDDMLRFMADPANN